MRVYLLFLILFLILCSGAICAGLQVDMGARLDSSNPVHSHPDAMSNGSAWISGVVQSADNRPLANVTVEILGGLPGLQRPVSSYSGVDGHFQFYDLATGEYDLIATQGLTTTRGRLLASSGLNFVVLTMPGQQQSDENGQATTTTAQLSVPNKARRELQNAEEALHNNKVVQASRSIEKALTFWPRYAEALILRAIIERGQESSELAIADAEKAIEYDPNYGKAYVVLGSVYTDVKRWNEAIRTLYRGIGIAPNSWQGYYEMSRALLCKGDFTTALRQAEKASTLARMDYPSFHLIKGYAFLGLKDETAARSELQQYVKLAPDTKPALHVRQILEQLADTSRSANSN